MDKTGKQEAVAGTALSDNEIIERVLRGEKNLYGIIVRRYNQRLYRIAISIINDDAEAEDIMQVSYINAYEGLAKFAFKSSFSTWITKILINESLLRIKKRKKATIALTEMIVGNAYHQTQIPAMQATDAKALNTELKLILEKSIQQLPEKYRTVFIMREMEGMNIVETKNCLDISEVNVKVRLNRAKSLLKTALAEFYKNEDILHFHLSRCDRMVNEVLEQINAFG